MLTASLLTVDLVALEGLFQRFPGFVWPCWDGAPDFLTNHWVALHLSSLAWWTQLFFKQPISSPLPATSLAPECCSNTEMLLTSAHTPTLPRCRHTTSPQEHPAAPPPWQVLLFPCYPIYFRLTWTLRERLQHSAKLLCKLSLCFSLYIYLQGPYFLSYPVDEPLVPRVVPDHASSFV